MLKNWTWIEHNFMANALKYQEYDPLAKELKTRTNFHKAHCHSMRLKYPHYNF